MGIKDNVLSKKMSRLETGFSSWMSARLNPLEKWQKEVQVSLLSRLSRIKNSDVERNLPKVESSKSTELQEMTVEIEMRNLSKIFGTDPRSALEQLNSGKGKEEILKNTGLTVGLRNVDLTIYKGEIFVLMGLSGCGKSTLERCINSLLKPTAGSIIVNGTEITSLDTQSLRDFRRHHISMVFQNFGLIPHRTVLDNVAYGLEVQGMPREERYEKANRAIDLVGLSGYVNAKPSSLSGGMKQRVGLARAIATDPEILLMDEAFSALDPMIRKNMQEELLDLQEKLKKTIVFVTHDLDEALKLGDRIAIMRDGAIIQVGTPEEILTKPADDYVATFVDGIDRSKVLTCENVMKIPEVVIPLKTGPRTALKMLDDKGQTIGFIIDKEKRFVGIIRAEDLSRALERTATLLEIIDSSIRTVAPTTSVEELIPILIETNYPIPVLNDKRGLVGAVYPASVIGKLRSKVVQS